MYFKKKRCAIIYANVKNNFCDSSKPYRGSFFQSCGASSEGFPEAVTFNSASVNVGNVTIRCGLDVPPEYFQKKTNTPNDFDLYSYTTVGVGGTFTGFFSAAEIASSTNTPGSIADHFRLNLSHSQPDDRIFVAGSKGKIAKIESTSN